MPLPARRANHHTISDRCHASSTYVPQQLSHIRDVGHAQHSRFCPAYALLRIAGRLVPLSRLSGSDPRVCSTILSSLRTLVSTLTARIKNSLVAQMHYWSGLLNERKIFLCVTSAVSGQRSRIQICDKNLDLTKET
jgi:hypothetical protein